MEQEWMGRTKRLREQPPAWPRPDEDFGPEPRRLQRPVELFEESSAFEVYPAATVMEDLAEPGDELATLRILARYTVLRLFVLSGAGWLAAAKLRQERRIALEHLTLLPEQDWERLTLERLANLCRETPAESIIAAAAVSAESAAKRGHIMGAFAIYRSAFELARRRAWWSEAAAVARGVSRLARFDEAHYSARLWERRARVLERRVARQLALEEAALNAAKDSPGGL